MKSSKQSRREAKELFRSCLVNGALDEHKVRQVVARVIEARPRGFAAVLGHFQRLVKLEIARRTARVESAVPLPPDLEAAVKNSLTRIYGAGLDLSFARNPALIGGMRIKVGS